MIVSKIGDLSLSFGGKLRFKKLTPIVKGKSQAAVENQSIDTKDICKIVGLNINVTAFARELGLSLNYKNFHSFENSVNKLALIELNNGLIYRSGIPVKTVQDAYNKVLNNSNEIEL